MRILYLFQENATELFPRKVQRSLDARPRRRAQSHRIANQDILDNLGMEDFPDELCGFADDLRVFLDHMNEFPEFTDEALNAAITTFEEDLKVLVVLTICMLFSANS